METTIQKGRRPEEKKFEEKLIRILAKDIEGGLNVYVGLTKIKGISWSLSNAICKSLNFDKKRNKIERMKKQNKETEKVEDKKEEKSKEEESKE